MRSTCSQTNATKDQLIWNWSGEPSLNLFRGFVDETIRDGLQAPYAPHIDAQGKLLFLRAMAQAGVSDALIGMATHVSHEELRQLVRRLGAGVAIPQPWVLTRSLQQDVERFMLLHDESGCELGLNIFLNVGRLRNHVEGWTLDEQLERASHVIAWARARGAKLVRVGLEDATRAHPADLRGVIAMLAASAVDRVAIADTAGVADESATAGLIGFFRQEMTDLAADRPAIEWHGHNDRGLAVANSLMAIKAGASYVHATALGIGERNGNASLECLIVNASLMGYPFERWAGLENYVELAKQHFKEWDVHMLPFFGKYSFCSGTGTHLAACSKAMELGREDLAKVLFSPDSKVNEGRILECVVSPASGRRGVQMAFDQLSLDATPGAVERALRMTQSLGRTLSREELFQLAGAA